MNTAVSVQKNPVAQLDQFIQKHRVQVQRALAGQLDLDRVIRVCLTAVRKNPKLLQCTPESIFGCLVQSSELGLELSSVLGHCFMVPYWNGKDKVLEASFQIGYKGLVALAYRSGLVSSVNARVVYEKDDFDVSYGTYEEIRHKPSRVADPGEATDFYNVINLKDGSRIFHVMSRAQVEKHAKQYSRTYGKDDSPWTTAFEAMALKTVCRQNHKWAPLTTEVQTAVALDELAEAGVPQQLGLAADLRTAEATRSRLDALKARLGRPGPEEGPEPAAPEIAPPEAVQALLEGARQMQWDAAKLKAFLEPWGVEQPQGLSGEQAQEALQQLQTLIDEQLATND